MLKIGHLLRQQREAAGLSQEQLAQRLHVTRQAVSKWERDLSYPDVAMLVELATVLHCDIRILVGMKQKMRWRGLFRWRAEEKEVKWYAGGEERRRIAIVTLAALITQLTPEQAAVRPLLEQEYNRFMTDGTSIPYMLQTMHLQVAGTMHKTHTTFTPEAEASYQKLLRLSHLRYY